MNRRYRLTSSSDIRRVRRTGKSYAHPLAILYISPNQLNITRFGVVAGRSLGNAVRRNRAKRRLRAAITPHLKNTTPGWDVIFIARQALLYSEWSKLRSGIAELLHRAMILK